MTRPALWSACSVNPANTSISRRWNGFSASGIESQDGSVSGRGVSLAFCGIQPSCFCRANARSRYLSQPSSNFPLYLSAHSFMTWCGPWDAPGAQYIRNGLSGANACCSRSHRMASSAMSSVRW